MIDSKDPFREESIDFVKYIKRYMFLWPYFVLSMALALGIAYFIGLHDKVYYENSVVLLIHEDKGLLDFEQQFSPILSAPSGSFMKNQLGIINSRSLIQKSLNKLDFGIEVYRKVGFSEQEIYPNPYFYIEIDSVSPQAVNVPFQLRSIENGQWRLEVHLDFNSLYDFQSQEFRGRASQESIVVDIEEGEWIEHSAFRLRITNLEQTPNEDDFDFILRDIHSLSRRFRANLTAEEIQGSTMVNLSLKGQNPRKNTTFLNLHARNYLNRELELRNQKAQKTIDFIDRQLLLVSSSLNISESKLENYRTNKQILNFDFQTQSTIQQLERLQQQKAQLLLREKYYTYLLSYLDEDDDGTNLIAPSSMGVEDAVLSGLINQLILLFNERSELQINSRRDNPLIANVQSRISHTKRTIKENLHSLQRANTIAKDGLIERIDNLLVQIQSLPESQKNLFNMERQFILHDELFTFLQRKKSEMEISKSGFAPMHEIIDYSLASEARSIGGSNKIRMVTAFILGLLIPIAGIFVFNLFNDKIQSLEEIEGVSPFPVLGFVVKNPDIENKIISFDRPSILGDSIRLIRTNAQFVLPTDVACPVILLSSNIQNEGKTYLSLNLALSFASIGKKTLLLSMDLRKPKLQTYMNKDAEKGISNFLSSNMSLDDILVSYENLTVAFSGQIPPNPTELINSSRTHDLFKEAKTKFDLILVDTPPIGLIADGLLLLEYSDAFFFVVRHNVTPKKLLEQNLKSLKEKQVKNLNILVNGVPQNTNYNQYNASYALYNNYYSKD